MTTGRGSSSSHKARRVPTRTQGRRSPQSPPLFRVMVTDAIKTWVVPALAGCTAAGFWLFSLAGLVSDPAAVAGVSFALFVLVMFTSLRHFFFSEEPVARRFSVIFAVFWLLVLMANVYWRIFPGSPLSTGVLRSGSAALSIPPRSGFRLIVDGRFKPSTAQGTRAGQYRLELATGDGEKRFIEGKFQDSWARQRLGRRGSTLVEIQHTSVMHRIRLRTATSATLKIAEVDPSLEPDLAISVVPDSHPWVFPVVGAFGILVTLAMEKRLKGDGGAVMMASVTCLVVDAFLRWAAPHPGIRDLVGAILVGGILGAPLAAILWRFVPRRWFAHH